MKSDGVNDVPKYLEQDHPTDTVRVRLRRPPGIFSRHCERFVVVTAGFDVRYGPLDESRTRGAVVTAVHFSRKLILLQFLTNVRGRSQADEYLLSVDVHAEKTSIWWYEFLQELHIPFVGHAYWFYLNTVRR